MAVGVGPAGGLWICVWCSELGGIWMPSFCTPVLSLVADTDGTVCTHRYYSSVARFEMGIDSLSVSVTSWQLQDHQNLLQCIAFKLKCFFRFKACYCKQSSSYVPHNLTKLQTNNAAGRRHCCSPMFQVRISLCVSYNMRTQGIGMQK